MALPALEVRVVSKAYSFHRPERSSNWSRPKHVIPQSFGLDAPEPGPGKDTFWALREVDFSLESGQSIGVIGKNGSGKSTLLKIISRIFRPTSGAVIVRGRRHSLLEFGTGFHPDLSGRKNIYLGAAMFGFARSETDALFDRIVDFSGIGTFIDTPVKFYSAGMYVRLAFSVGVHMKPDLLVLDEVVAVGDAVFQKRCREKISEIVRDGCALLLASHDASKISSFCREAIWLRAGRVAGRGPAAEISRQYAGEGMSPV